MSTPPGACAGNEANPTTHVVSWERTPPDLWNRTPQPTARWRFVEPDPTKEMVRLPGLS